jgi:hypothetical protein
MGNGKELWQETLNIETEKREWKHQMTSAKLQIISNQPNSKSQKLFRSFGIGAWNLFGICNLGFGIFRLAGRRGLYAAGH